MRMGMSLRPRQPAQETVKACTKNSSLKGKPTLSEEKRESIDYLVSSLKVMLINVLDLEQGKTKIEAKIKDIK